MASKLNLLARFPKASADDRAPTSTLVDGPAWKNRRPWYDSTHLAAALGIFVSLTTSLAAQAGDILRGGAPAGSKGGNSAGGAISAQAAQANANAKDALARTTQAVQSVKAMQKAAREAASGADNLGLNPNVPGQRLQNVPNGLAPGGLQVAPGVPADLAKPGAGEDSSLWKGANLPYQTSSGGRTSVIVQQTSDQAVLTWQTFNVGKKTTLEFDQSKGGDKRGQWVAFNKIKDPSGAPSQILGSIKADGQVYVINQNGIIFGGTSQINTHTLVASSLAINDNLIQNGLLNNPKAEFLFSAPTGSSTLPGDVVVQAGALLSSPTTPEHVGGRVALIGPNVSNAGTIETPDGQTILAAGLQVGFAAHASSDPSLRGLDVFVGSQAISTGTVANFGLISAQRASVLLTGKNVDQLGVIDSSTSVTLNGRIDLLADYDAITNTAYDPVKLPNVPPFFLRSSGNVTLGPGSVTQILPETSSSEKLASAALPLQSQINLRGLGIHLGSDSTILAPSAKVSLQAGRWDYRLNGQTQTSGFFFTSSNDLTIQPQIYLDKGATINVAGSSNVEAPVTQNILSVDVRGAELADSPLQRTGPVRGTTIQVDLRIHGPWDPTLNDGKGDYSWVGTPLANARGYRDLVQRSVGELTTAGGTVSLQSGGSVVLQLGSTIDVSGGSISYLGGMVKTTRLVSDGQIFDISQATPDRVYAGVYTGTSTRSHLKYGINETFTNPLALAGIHFEPGYIEGAPGGSIAITAPAVALDGTLLGLTVAGPRQQTETAAPSSLALTFQQQDNFAADAGHFAFSPTPPSIIFQTDTSLSPAASFGLDSLGHPLPLDPERKKRVVLSPDLLTVAGFGKLTIDNSDGNIVIPAGVSLAAAPGSGAGRSLISLTAANLTIDGKVSAPGGDLQFVANGATPYQSHRLPIPDPQDPGPSLREKAGIFTLGERASLTTAGLVVDENVATSGNALSPFTIDGGTISIKAFSADLAVGSTIDVSGGISSTATGKRTFGKAGKIEIKAGQDPLFAFLAGGQLILGSDLRGFSGVSGGGGSLSILAPLVQIGGTMPATATARVGGLDVPRLKINGTLVDPEAFLYLTPDFFNQGGFQSFSISGLGMVAASSGQYLPAVSIAPGTVLAPQALSLVAAASDRESGVQLIPMLLPTAQRSPVSLAFGANGVPTFISTEANPLTARGDFVMGSGALIQTDPGASVSITGDTVTILGSIIAPAGSIAVTGGSDSIKLFKGNLSRALATVHLSSETVLSAAGTSVIYEDGRGFRAGKVLAGGTISVSGNIIAESGAVLDVSGTSSILDLAPQFSGLLSLESAPSTIDPLHGSLLGSPLVATRVESNAGKIVLKGGQLLFTDATLRGAAGGPSTLGGTLEISSGVLADPAIPKTPLDVTLTVQQGGKAIPNTFNSQGVSVIGRAAVDLPYLASGGGHLTVSSFASGGFDVVNLRGTVKFDGPVSMTAGRELHVGDGGVIFANAETRLSAPYVALGMAFQTPQTSVQAAQQLSVFVNSGAPFFFAPTYGPGRLTVSADLIDIGNLSLQGIGKADFVAHNGEIRGDGTFNVAGEISLTAAQIYPATGVSFTITAFDYLRNGAPQSGTVKIAASGSRSLPLSAGGTLSIYASVIEQAGVLRAPLGQINLGWDGTGTAPKNLISGSTIATPATKTVTLAAGSVTSVSLVDSTTGEAALIPYGLNLIGQQWIDPSGTDITAGGLPGKTISIAGVSIVQQSGSLIDLSGGGDLFSYRWVPGVGGSKDVLDTSSSFAIIPNYQGNYAPYAPYNSNPTTSNLGGDPGYVSSSLKIGERIHLEGGGGLPAGDYTLLPARYALLPGAFLITPKSGAPLASFTMPDGSGIVAGYRSGQSLYSRFEVASSAVVRARAQYEGYSANDFLKEGALVNNAKVPRLPIDAGHLVLQATQSIVLEGDVRARGADGGGRGGLVDIASVSDILISGSGAGGLGGTLVLDASRLSSFGAESLLIGGVRSLTTDGAIVTVKTNNVTVDNAGSPLTAPEIILVAKKNLVLAPGAEIAQSGKLLGDADQLFLGNSTVPGSGDGVLLRVSSDPHAETTRLGVTTSSVPHLTIGAGARVSGTSLILDSTAGATLAPTATLDGEFISLNSGQIIVQLDPNAAVPTPTTALVLSGTALAGLQNSLSLSLLSYGSLDIYGSGAFVTTGNLALHAAEIRGFDNGGGVAQFTAGTITLDNRADPTGPGRDPALNVALPGTLALNADTVLLGVGQLNINRFESVAITATNQILVTGSGGLHTAGTLSATSALVTAADSTKYSVIAVGDLTLNASATPATSAATAGGLGATLKLSGSSVSVGSDVVLRSGSLTLQATGANATHGVTVSGRLDVRGTAQEFYDLIKYTSGGEINLSARSGDITIEQTGALLVSAEAGGGDAGKVSISTPQGTFTLAGEMSGMASLGGTAGSFSLDVKSLGSMTTLAPGLLAGGFTEAQSFRVRTGDVLIDSDIKAHTFSLSADGGGIFVSRTIDASGPTGGTIQLVAARSVVLENGSTLTVEGDDFSNAGKGGAISLEAGAAINGTAAVGGVRDAGTGLFNAGAAVVDIQAGATLNLGVKTAATAALGDFTGTLHLRAPQTTAGTDLQVNRIRGDIVGSPSAIVVEGYRVYQTDTIDNVIGQVSGNATTFANATTFLPDTLFGSGSPLLPSVVITPGAEIINRNGDLTLNSDWDLSTFRFGPKNAPGILTLRASRNLVFNGALSDGFDPTLQRDGVALLYLAPLMNYNPNLPANVQSWSYRMSAGADFSAADFHQVQPISSLGTGAGSLLLGQPYTPLSPDPGNLTLIALLGSNVYQVIRTGSGEIDISVGRDVQLLNPFATIYTAGTQVSDPSKVLTSGDFDLPNPQEITQSPDLGAYQFPTWAPQFSFAGGNVTIAAQGDIKHQTATGQAESGHQLPTNWLYRRSQVGADGKFATSTFGDVASTSWWVDFSNFFEGIGTLGGGDVTLRAGGNVTNVDAVVATNARMAGKAAGGLATSPDASAMVELGGGNLLVQAGGDIDGGVYYVERGQGVLTAGNTIHTNATRAPSSAVVTGGAIVEPETTWLPTTLFLGKGSFNVSARGDITLGPVVNAFLVPPGISNNPAYRTYFSTYAEDSSVEVTSQGGSIDLRTAGTLTGQSMPILQLWMSKVSVLATGSESSVASYEPWIRLSETTVLPFGTALSLLPGTVRATAFSGDINLAGNLTLSPAPRGTLELLAGGAINGLRPIGSNALFGAIWDSSRIIVSDANPANLPSITAPLAVQAFPPSTTDPTVTQPQVFIALDALFAESGSILGDRASIQSKLALHDFSLLHEGDTAPLRLYSSKGNIADLALYSPKITRVFAGNDLTDVGLYLQNVAPEDFTVVAAGHDIIPYNPNAPLLQKAQAARNSTSLAYLNINPAQSGDIQINGPGTLEVLAGHNLDLGSGRNADLPADLGVGITSNGNLRNPGLPFVGADIIVGAGVGGPDGLPDNADLNFSSFIDKYLGTDAAGAADLLTGSGQPTGQQSELSDEEQAKLALDIFFRVLRDAGRDYSNVSSPNYQSPAAYTPGFAAISELFGTSATEGEINLSSRSLKTSSGGNISIIAPGGGISLGFDIPAGDQVPPGIVTEAGGNISIFADKSVQVGALRIFTLRGGSEIIWSSTGDIAAGNASKTVQTAPPTRVVIDAASANVQTDLAGLATGGGIGVLATVGGVAPGNVDLIAPAGVVDAGDAGIRATGTLNIAAVIVLNADNIQASNSTGVPTAPQPTAVNLGSITQANNTAAAGSNAATDAANQARGQGEQLDMPSIITVEVVGYQADEDRTQQRKKDEEKANAQ